MTAEPTRRALWVTASPPAYDSGGGGHIRQAHLLDALSSRFETHLLLAGRLRDQRLRSKLASVREVAVSLPPPPARGLNRRVRALRWTLLERQAVEVAQHREIRTALAPWIEAGPPPDLVCVEYVGLAPLLPRRRSGFWTLTLHNLTSGMARQAAAVAPTRRQRLMLAAEARNSRRVERWAAAAYDAVVAVSEEDAAELPSGVIVVPNGVDTNLFRATPIAESPRVVFTGALNTVPNRDGIEWFCREVWPRVRTLLPGAELEIVGSHPPAEILGLGGIDGVSVHADVDSVVPFLERARAAVAPLRIGTGSRLKVLEAMAAARPVVGTAIGIGGIAAEPGRDLIVAGAAPEFAEALVRCLRDDELAARIGRDGRTLVERRYAWSRIGERYASLLSEMASDPARLR